MRAPYTQLYVHCVWATWDRLPLITPQIEARLYACIAAKCRDLKCEVLAIGGDMDHVHVLVELPSVLSIAILMKEIKGASSHFMTHEVTRDREFKWQGGYGAFTVSHNGVNKVKEYVL